MKKRKQPTIELTFDEVFALTEVTKFSPVRRTKVQNAIEYRLETWLDEVSGFGND